jgi:hypothetical protein
MLAAIDVVLGVQVYRSAGWPGVMLGVILVTILLVVDARRPKHRKRSRR